MRIIKYIFCAILFVGVAFAENITINWGKDNQPYTTTTCEIGGDVVLPTVSKRGHIFRGWQAEHFYRGTFSNWTSLKQFATTQYGKDYFNNSMPTEGDFIIVSDAFDFINSEVNIITLYHEKNYKQIRYSYYDYLTENTKEDVISGDGTSFGKNKELKFEARGDGYIRISANTDILFDGKLYHAGEEVFKEHWTYTSTRVFYISTNILSGAWKFIYHGNWATDGKYGWKPAYQITNQNE